MTDTITVPVEPKKEWRIVNDDWGYAMLLERDDGLIVHLNPGTFSNTTGVPALLADLAAAPRPDDELARLEREIAQLKNVLNEFHQVCPNKHPYAFYTAKSECMECESEAEVARWKTIANTPQHAWKARAIAAEAKLLAVRELPVIFADTKACVTERVVRADALEAALKDTATP